MQASDEMNGLGFQSSLCVTLGAAFPRKAALRGALAIALISALPACTTALNAYDKNCSAFAVSQSLPFELKVGDGRIAVNGHDVIVEIKTEPKWLCHDTHGSEEIYSIVGRKYRVDITYKANASRREIEEKLNDRSSPPDMANSVMEIIYLGAGKSGLLRIISERYI